LGGYLSSFSLGSDVQDVYGITYAPGTPQDVLVLLKNNAGNHVIRAYSRSQTTRQSTQVVYDCQSGETTLATCQSTGATDLSTLNMPVTLANMPINGNIWDYVNGFEYDPLHNRFLVSFQSGAGYSAQILSMDAAITPLNAGDQAVNTFAVDVSNILNPYESNTYLGAGPNSETVTAMTFDPLNNQVYMAANNTSAGKTTTYYYQIVPNVKLNRVRQQ
jgi:hypothetical protein